MSELKITLNSLENAILKDGLFVSGYVDGVNSSIAVSGSGARANGAVIFGGYILANGYGAHAEGYSGSLGNFILANGDGAHAEGYSSSTGPINASGNGAHAEGWATSALAHGAHAEGSCTTAFGEFSHVEGWGEPISSSTYELSHIRSTSTGETVCTLNSSLSECNIYLGSIIKFSDNNSTKYGIVSNIPASKTFVVNNTIDSTFTTILVHTGASGTASHAEGKSTLASGTASHAEGSGSVANDSYSHAEGIGSKATNKAAHAEGGGTTASGECSHAEGGFTVAEGFYSHAGGCGTIANQEAMTAIGKYNVSTNTENTLFVVGNGTSSQRSNAFWVKDDGTAHTTGGFYDESDIRKKDILSNISLEKSYELLDKCQEIIYTLKEEPNKKEQVGMIAQEVEEFFPEIVSTDSEGFKSLDYARLSVICLRLIKDIVELIKELKNEIKNLNG